MQRPALRWPRTRSRRRSSCHRTARLGCPERRAARSAGRARSRNARGHRSRPAARAALSADTIRAASPRAQRARGGNRGDALAADARRRQGGRRGRRPAAAADQQVIASACSSSGSNRRTNSIASVDPGQLLPLAERSHPADQSGSLVPSSRSVVEHVAHRADARRSTASSGRSRSRSPSPRARRPAGTA